MIDPVSATEARAKFQEIINRVEYGKERLLIERHGKPVVAVIGLDDLKRLETLEDAIDSAQLREAIAQNAGFTTLEAVIAQHTHE